MIGIFFRPDKTQIVRAKIKSDKKIYVKEFLEIASYCQSFLNESEQSIFKIFQDLKTKFKFGNEDIFLVLPDEFFEMIDTTNITNDDELRRFVEDGTGLNFEEVYISIPIESTPGTNHKKTICAIQKFFVDEIAQTADRLNMQVVSIESASVAMFRALGDWKREKILVPVTEFSADIFSYSPLGGIFKFETDLAEKNFLENITAAEEELKSAIRKRDIAAEYTFTSINENVPVNILNERININLGVRQGEELKFQNCVVVEKNIIQSDWLAVVGTLLQNYGEESEIFADCPQFLKNGSGNILPKEMQVGTQIKHWRQVATNIFNRVAVIMFAVLALEIGVIFYLNTIKISEELQTKYDTAQKSDSNLSREIKIIELAKKEDEKPTEVFSTLMKYRMDNLFLTNFSVGGSDSANNWVKFQAVAEDPILFQDLLSRLRDEKKFTNCGLAEISSDTSNFKKANFNLGKGRDEK